MLKNAVDCYMYHITCGIQVTFVKHILQFLQLSELVSM
jgi:hypothetical protein